MATPGKPATPTTGSELRELVIAALAEVRAAEVDVVLAELEEQAFEIDSKEAEVVISILEQRFDRQLAKVEDLEPEQMVTLNALTNLLARDLLSEPTRSSGHMRASVGS
jgi:hypothetical protein